MTGRKPLVLSAGKLEQIQSGDALLLPACGTGNASLNAPHGTAPSSPVDGDVWTTTAGIFVRINGVTIGPLNVPATASTTDVLTGTDSSKYTTADAIAALWEKGTDVASGATTTIGEGGFFHITGTTTITAFAFSTDKTGRRALLKFDGILTLTQNATSLILPTGANINTAAGDCAEIVSEGSGNFRIVSYTRADGTALSASDGGTPNLAFPFVQEGYFSTSSNVTSFTCTFPQAAASSGKTLWMIAACDGSSTVTVPTGWTADINQQQNTYARLIVCHKTSASDTSATWTVASASSFAVAFFELDGTRTLDASSSGGTANAAIVAMPAITPTTGSMVFAAACEVAGGGGPLAQGSSISPVWNNVSILGGGGNGQRMLFVHIYLAQGGGATLTPPPINNNGQGLFASGGIAYASFSIL